MISTKLYNAGLDGDFAKRIIGETEEEIDADIATLKEFITQQKNKAVETEINTRLAGKAPEGGAKPDVGGLQAAYNDAKAKNDGPLKMSIIRQAAREGIEIKQ